MHSINAHHQHYFIFLLFDLFFFVFFFDRILHRSVAYSSINYCNYKYIHFIIYYQIAIPNEMQTWTVSNAKQVKTTTTGWVLSLSCGVGFFSVWCVLVITNRRVCTTTRANYDRVIVTGTTNESEFMVLKNLWQKNGFAIEVPRFAMYLLCIIYSSRRERDKKKEENAGAIKLHYNCKWKTWTKKKIYNLVAGLNGELFPFYILSIVSSICIDAMRMPKCIDGSVRQRDYQQLAVYCKVKTEWYCLYLFEFAFLQYSLHKTLCLCVCMGGMVWFMRRKQSNCVLFDY